MRKINESLLSYQLKLMSWRMEREVLELELNQKDHKASGKLFKALIALKTNLKPTEIMIN